MAHAAPPSLWYQRMFAGAEGLRHGWRFALFVLAIWLVSRLVEPLIPQLRAGLGINPEELSAPSLILAELIGLLEVLAVTFIAALLERRRIDDYGLPLRQAFGTLYWKGAIAALAVVVFVSAAMILCSGMKVLGLAMPAKQAVTSGLLWMLAMILVGLEEEYLFRGYALQSLWRGAGFWPAALITTALFAGLHLSKPHENAMDIGMIFLLGLAMCLSVRRTGTLWWAAGWHAAFDFGQFFLIGTHNGGQEPEGHLLNVVFSGPAWITGGELGTEASAFMIPAAFATFVYAGWFLKVNGSSPMRDAGTHLAS